MPIGNVDGLPAAVRRELERTVAATRDCRSLTLVTALNYGARTEIAHAAQKIAEDVRAGRITPEAVDEALIEERLYTAGLPELDLLIRTGGEMRVSNFLLWQLSYAEFYVTSTWWPDFGRDDLLEALHEYARRDRRFGGLSRQDRASATAKQDGVR
jgi:undecaprenyl diphosphate synthase